MRPSTRATPEALRPSLREETDLFAVLWQSLLEWLADVGPVALELFGALPARENCGPDTKSHDSRLQCSRAALDSDCIASGILPLPTSSCAPCTANGLADWHLRSNEAADLVAGENEGLRREGRQLLEACKHIRRGSLRYEGVSFFLMTQARTSKNLPHPPANSVSPVNRKLGSVVFEA